MERVENLREEFRETCDEQEMAAFETEKAKYLAEHPDHKAQEEQAYPSAGDMCRFTFISVSAVEN
eukprot:8910916-Pyramimonas_sp.AAC.1